MYIAIALILILIFVYEIPRYISTNREIVSKYSEKVHKILENNDSDGINYKALLYAQDKAINYEKEMHKMGIEPNEFCIELCAQCKYNKYIIHPHCSCCNGKELQIPKK